MPQETVSQRLKFLIKALGLNPRSFSEKYDVNESTTRGYIGRGSIPNADYIGTLVRSIENLNPLWLLLGEGEMFLNEVSEPHTVYQTKNTGNVIGHNSGTASQQNITDASTAAALAAAHKENELLRSQLADKERIIQLLEMQLKK